MKKQILSAATAAGIMLTAFGGAASAHENIYNVQSGDSLWKISQINNLTVSQLKSWNNLSGDTIYVNQKLSLLAPHSHTTTAATTPSASVINYTVKSGDNLWNLARTYSTSVSAIKSLNGLTSDTIYVGQNLKISGSSQTVTTASTPTPVTSTSTTTYTVKSGDTLSGLAVTYKTTVSAIKSLNSLTTDTIYVGQTLKIGGQAVATSTSVTTTTTKTTTITTTTTSSVSKADAVVAEAKKYIGTPYVWGGNTPSGFDCSGFVKYVFAKVGITLPRTVATIWDATTPVSSPRPGDILFYQTYKTGPSHAGIYIGNNKMIQAGSNGVAVSDITYSYWTTRYLGTRTAF
ncbi:LysM peptidoglycan-binding domain-containing protein [Neobacillus terrae]|uniref:C40 family peptidase n=1 Tax=Neobacillus terrae TaxID=3034837 RepID=UPI00140B7001|nr:peptidoglycan endopeptidase [Neobacillus terrae]NHM32716.1 LysM peptidoglycan-binding domain-containing protein [Neobacillus terrae]